MAQTDLTKKFFPMVLGILLCCLGTFAVMGIGAYKLNVRAQSQADQEANRILGLWQGVEVEDIALEIQQDNNHAYCYLGIQASDNDINSYRGEVVLEFCYSFRDKQYIGRHLWGGGKSEITRWGQDGGVIIELKDNNVMFMRFLDSIYSDGWTLERKN